MGNPIVSKNFGFQCRYTPIHTVRPIIFAQRLKTIAEYFPDGQYTEYNMYSHVGQCFLAIDLNE